MGSIQRGNLPHMINLLIANLILASWTTQLAYCKNSPIVAHDAGGGGGDCSDIGLSTADCASLAHLNLKGFISYDNMTTVDSDWGFMIHLPAAGILYPQSVSDIVAVVQAVASSKSGLTVAARGNGHSVHGQAQARDGIVIKMSTLRGIKVMPDGDADIHEPYVEAAGGELWIDVLKATLKQGLAPRSWTDYLYLSVGGTLSNAGISGQAFRHGPQISNVFQLEVVTGQGELLWCSPSERADLFYAVLGGLGQFGIITKARINLEPAPEKVRWMRAIYTDFQMFRTDIEMLISETTDDNDDDDDDDDCEVHHRFDYVEGFVVLNNRDPNYNGWKNIPFSPGDINSSMIPEDAGSVMYCIEVTKAYNSADDLLSLKERIEKIMKPLSFDRSLLFTTDVSYYKFLNRLQDMESKMRAEGLWEVPHPWVNLLVPRSSITKFDAHVFKSLVADTFSGPVLVYPLNRSKWDRRLDVSVPEEDVFYLAAFLRNSHTASGRGLQHILEDNARILELCETLGCKQYFPTYESQAQWERHFGSKWDVFVDRKRTFDPHAILSPGQNIFRRCESLLIAAT